MATGQAQNYEAKADTSGIVTNSFWDNWFLQVGADMILLFPVKDVDMETGDGMVHYHHSPKDVFPNGKSLGVSVAAGKWFTPVFGAKLKVNWNNIIKDNYNVWYHPYGETNGSQHNGGFLNIAGDIMFNLHNLFGEYKPDRRWNLSVGPRAGTWILVREGKGGPILGVGVYNTYRLNDKWKLFGDVNYSFVSSLNDADSGTGHFLGQARAQNLSPVKTEHRIDDERTVELHDQLLRCLPGFGQTVLGIGHVDVVVDVAVVRGEMPPGDAQGYAAVVAVEMDRRNDHAYLPF
jgi:hypothetical protein